MINIESNIFEFDGYDQQDDMAYTYYKCKLTQNLGEFKKDEIIDSIYINFDTSEMTFYKGNEVIGEFHLTLSALQV